MGTPPTPRSSQDTLQTNQGIIYAIQHTQEDISKRDGQVRTLLVLLRNHALRRAQGDRRLHDLKSLFIKLHELPRLCRAATGRAWTVVEVCMAAKNLELPHAFLASIKYDPKSFTAASLPGPPDRSMLRGGEVLGPEDASHFRRSQIEKFAARNRSLYIVILEVDAIKGMAGKEDYTLSNNSRILVFLSGLIERYSLARLEDGGALRKYRARILFSAMRDTYRIHQEGAPTRKRPWATFWRTGSENIKSAWMKQTRDVTQELSEAEALPLHDPTNAEWRFSVIEALVKSIPTIPDSNSSDSRSELEETAPSPSPTTQSSEIAPYWNMASSVPGSIEHTQLGQVRTTRFLGSYNEQTSQSGLRETTSQPSQMYLSSTPHSTEMAADAHIAQVDYSRIVSLLNPSKAASASTFSSNTGLEDGSSIDSQPFTTLANIASLNIERRGRNGKGVGLFADAYEISPAPEFHIDTIVAGMKEMRRHLRIVIQSFFDLIKLRPNDTSPDIPHGGLEQLCAYCWGDEWQQVFYQLRDTYNLMPSLDTLIALSSAYLDRQLLARAESFSKARNKDGYNVDSLLRRAAFCATTKAELTPSFIRSDAESLAKDLQSILRPYLQALINTAAAKRLLDSRTYTGLWEHTFYRQMTDLFEKAILLKLQMAASPHEYRTFWPKHGTLFAPDTMTLAYPTKSESKRLQVAYTVHCGLKVKYWIGDEEHEAIEVEAEIASQRMRLRKGEDTAKEATEILWILVEQTGEHWEACLFGHF